MFYQKWISKYRFDLEFKGYSKSSIELYVPIIFKFLSDFSYLYREPKEIKSDTIKIWIKENSKSVSSLRIKIGALKTFYKYTVRQPLKFKYIEYPKKEYKSPIILDISEVQKIFDACTNEKHRCIMFVLYATGVRVSELLAIKLSDIDRANMVIHIMHGKGNKQRAVTMKPELLAILEKYYRIYKSKVFLFEGQNGGEYTESSIRQFLKKYALIAGIKKKVYPHLLRHCSFTHSLEAGENLYTIQRIAGHNNPKTTSIYLHMSNKIIANAYSPILNLCNNF